MDKEKIAKAAETHTDERGPLKQSLAVTIRKTSHGLNEVD